MILQESQAPRRGVPVFLVALGAAGLVTSMILSSDAAPIAALGLLLATLLAVRDASVPILTWANAVCLLILVVWLVPTKVYKLPADLPFDLEIYRLLVGAMALALVFSVLAGRASLSAGSQGLPLGLLACAALLSQFANYNDINEAGLGTDAVKSISFLMSFVVVFIVIVSTVARVDQVDRAFQALALGAVVVALLALYESRRGYNVFAHLDDWIPGFVQDRAVGGEVRRGGRLRVFGSAQHPIALGAALIMAVPPCLYLASRATSRARALLWLGAGVVVATGAFATVSRTVIVMLLAMGVVGLLIWRARALRWWPLAIVVAIVVHFIAPGTLGTLVRSLRPEAVTAQQQNRAGQQGSGRLADIGPGLEIWSQKPLLGHGLGTQLTTGSPEAVRIPASERGSAADVNSIIFDDQYLSSLVELGIIGLIAVAWFVWGVVVKLVSAARKQAGKRSALTAACAASCAGYALGMVTFDAFAFVQVTLLFFIIAALGLKARALVADQPRGTVS